jgi:serine protease Do
MTRLVRVAPILFLLAFTPAPLGAEVLADTAATADVVAWEKPAPANLDDLRQIESHIRKLLKTVGPATVHVQVGFANGSGVVVSKEGHVLTAAHVSGSPGRPARITFPDGQQVDGVSLGNYRGADAGLIQITEQGEWPVVPMGASTELKGGEWCFALGHPGGFDAERGPVLRVGRVRSATPPTVWTDCALLGGDSGGPLFDMSGRVIGIHSRIGRPIELNYHVAIDAFHATWDALAAGKEWRPAVAMLGVRTEPDTLGARVVEIAPDSGAARSPLLPGDVIRRLDEEDVADPESLGTLIRRKKPDQTIRLRIVRGAEELEIEATLGQAPEP